MPRQVNILAAIPAYNSEATVGKVVERTRAQVERVLVVDDGSEDRTAWVAREAGAHVIRLTSNRGKGRALQVAREVALQIDADALITLDADLQHEASEIPRFIERYNTTGAQIVSGNRMADKDHIPRIRCILNSIGTHAFSWLLGRRIDDSQCGFRLYDREVIRTLGFRNDRFEAEADILLRAGKRGWSIEFVPIEAIYSPEQGSRSHYRKVHDTFRICIIFLMNLFWKSR